MNAVAFYKTAFICRKCSNEIYKHKTKIGKLKKKEILFSKGFKFCTKCKKIKTLSYFSKNKSCFDGYRHYCKECDKKHYERYDPEKRKKYHIDNKEKENYSNKQWKVKNPEKVRRYNRIHERNRRAHKLKNGGIFTLKEWECLVWYYNDKCLCCKQIKFLEVDHIIPITKGGNSNISNLQPLCRSCNSTKRTTIIDYRPEPILD